MKVAIIGSGASGLTSIKCCLDEGLQPVCFEKENYIGGMWHFTEDPSRTGTVYRSTVINTSKEMMCYSDFPMPEEFPLYLHHTRVVDYFNRYANFFGLSKFIRFRSEVLGVKKTNDFETTGKWLVESCSATSSSELKKKGMVVEEFDAVMICIGHHWKPAWPNFKGMDIFEGLQMHSRSYKDFKGFEGKTVVIVGIGNSAGDIAVELSRHARQVHLSTRRGAWIVSRLHTEGLPADMYSLTRFNEFLPATLKDYFSPSTYNARFFHANLGLSPTHRFREQHPIINDALPSQIITGCVAIKPDIREFTRNGVIFTDETLIENLDCVIFCTGYDVRIPFLEIETDIVKPNNRINLYKFVFPPFLEKPTLAVIGNVQPSGAVNPVSEMQARWAVRVFAGKTTLPSKEVMIKDIGDKWEALWKQYYHTKRSTFKVEYISYCDELAEMIGCKPNLLKLFLTDPLLSLKCFFGPCTPAQYRLVGPGAWHGAKQAIENVKNNVVYPTKRRIANQTSSRRSLIMVLLAFVIIFTIVFI